MVLPYAANGDRTAVGAGNRLVPSHPVNLGRESFPDLPASTPASGTFSGLIQDGCRAIVRRRKPGGSPETYTAVSVLVVAGEGFEPSTFGL